MLHALPDASAVVLSRQIENEEALPRYACGHRRR
jgi:hypothetical protein